MMSLIFRLEEKSVSLEDANQKLVLMETSLGEKMKAIQSLQQVTILFCHSAKYRTNFSKQNILATGGEHKFGQNMHWVKGGGELAKKIKLRIPFKRYFLMGKLEWENIFSKDTNARNVVENFVQLNVQVKGELETSLQSAQEEIQHTLAEMTRKQTEMESRGSKFHEKVVELAALHEQMETLKTANAEQEEMLQKLREREAERAEELKNELADKEKKTEDLGQKMGTLKEQVADKNKQVKSLEKENKTLKSQLKTKTDKVSKQEDKVKTMEEAERSLREALGVSEEKLTESLAKIAELQGETSKEISQFKQDAESEQAKVTKLMEDLKMSEESVGKLKDLLKQSEECRVESEKEVAQCKVREIECGLN